ncbi:PH domain-containing protein [Micromonospora sp. CPCC 205371]|nr:PH domain-containing protein [Micromonospora sp. CPCC 205371]
MSQIWRVSLVGRIGALVVPVVGGLGGWLAGGPLGATVLGLLGLGAWWRWAMWPAVELADDRIVVRNPLGTREVPLREVSEVATGYGGLTIVTRDRQRVVAWAVQKSNAATWMKREVRADRVAAAIRAAARKPARRKAA